MKTLTIQEMQQVNGAGFFDSKPGWGALVGGLAGNFAGPWGAIVGSGAGHAIETTDFHALGENYKNSVAKDIAKGNIPAD